MINSTSCFPAGPYAFSEKESQIINGVMEKYVNLTYIFLSVSLKNSFSILLII